MIIDAHQPGCPHGALYNADTGERIPLAFWADLETGEYRYYVPNAVGLAQLDPEDPGELLTASGRARLRFESAEADEPVIVGRSGHA